MKIRERVAQNLKNLTVNHGTAAFVSREMGINPMQYGRYLSGQQMPNDATMERICSFFGVAELDLINPPSNTGDGLISLLAQPGYKDIISQSLDRVKPQIDEGWYFFYSQSEKYPDILARSPMIIKQENGVLTFRHFIAVAEKEHPKFRNILCDAHGIVSASRYHLYFGGVDVHGGDAPNLMAGYWSAQFPNIMVGQGMTLGPEGIMPLIFAAKKVRRKLSFLQLLKQSVILTRNSKEIPKDIMNALSHISA